MLGRRSVVRSLVLVAAVAALVLAFAASAFAAPAPGTWLSLQDLRARLAASADGTLPGYMKTVVKGDTVITIPVTILSVPIAGSPEVSLIHFEATGPLIDKYGGIVAGMSGSPIYLDSDNKLIGALSYGESFTIGGAGDATPIEAMSRIESLYKDAILPLANPVLANGSSYDKIVVTTTPEKFAGAAAAGTLVLEPLGTLNVGGINAGSTGFKKLAKDFADRGLGEISSARAGFTGDGGAGSFETTLVAGGSVSAAAVRGDAWMGGTGTITYINGDNLLAFGHPAYWAGTTAYYMTNAWIEGIWPNQDTPSKIPDFGKVRGTITQDRYAGILGKIGLEAPETTITATAVNVDDDAAVESTSSAIYMPRQLISNGFADSTLVAETAYIAGANLFDQRAQPGSAHTTTTVEVSDGAGHDYTVVMRNFIDSDYDITWDATMDTEAAIANLQSVLAWGNENVRVKSVKLEGEYSTHHQRATIVGVQAPNGIQVGANRILVQALVYGEPATQTIPATLTVPAGTALSGTLMATEMSDDSDYADMLSELGISVSVDMTGGRRSMKQIVSDLNDTRPANTLQITFQPSLSGLDLSEVDDPSKLPSTDPVTVYLPAEWPITGEADVNVTTISAQAVPNPLDYNDFPFIIGTVNGPSGVTTVTAYATTAGTSAETTVGVTKTSTFEGESEFIFYDLPAIRTNTTYRLHVDGTDGYTGADYYVNVRVKAPISLATSASRIKPGRTVKLTASVYPATATAGGTVVFERLSGKKWIRITSKTLNPSGAAAKASYTWKPGKGTQKVRARYLGGALNAANTSATKTIVVK